MIIKRVWEMPNKWTFKMKCVQELHSRYIIDDGIGWIDPFAGMNSPAQFTNDIDTTLSTWCHSDGLNFLKELIPGYVGALFDPPYSTEQCLRIYNPTKASHGGTCGRAEYWALCKDEIARIVNPEGTVISFGWDTVGMGKKRGFHIIEVLDICHGACHNDTLVTVEKKGAELRSKDGEK